MLQKHHINELPMDLLKLILQNLNYNQLLIASRVCKRFLKVILRDPTIWKLPVECKPLDYLRFSGVEKRLEGHRSGVNPLNIDNFHRLASELTTIPNAALFPHYNAAQINFLITFAKGSLLSKLSSPHSGKPLFHHIKSFLLALLGLAFIYSLLNRLPFFASNYFTENINCKLSNEVTFNKDNTFYFGAFALNVIAYMRYLVMKKIYLGLCLALLVLHAESRSDPILLRKYYSHIIPNTHLLERKSHTTLLKNTLLKMVHYRDFLSFILALFLQLILALRGFHNLAENYCFSTTLAECFESCAYGANHNTFFTNNKNNLTISFAFGFLFTYSLMAAFSRLEKYLENKPKKEPQYSLPTSYKLLAS